MKVVLFGATGKTGTRLLQELVSRGHQVTAAARDVRKLSGTVAHAVLELLCRLQQVAALLQQLGAGGRQADPRSRPFEHGDAEVLLQFRHRVRDRRGHPMQLGRRAGERAAPVDRIEHLQSVEADPQHSKLSIIGRQTIRFCFDQDPNILLPHRG